MNVLYLTDEEDTHLSELVERIGDRVKLHFIPRSNMDEAINRAPEFEIVIGALVPREFLEEASRLRFLIIPYTGVPQRDRANLVDYPGVTVINSHYNARSVAEHAWALLLAAAKRIGLGDRGLRVNDWSPRYDNNPSVSLFGKTLLLVGYGAIGETLAAMGRAFSMRVIAVKRTPGEAPELDFLGNSADLPRVLPEADAIIVSLPRTESTDGLLGEREFELMKDGVLFVNVGRGTSVDEEAFYHAMKSGKIGAAGIDAWWNYPKGKETRTNTSPSKHEFREFQNLVMSPHRASHVIDGELQRMESLAQILKSILAGNPVNTVDTEEWY